MNTKQLIATVAILAASGSALAEQTFPYVDFSNVSTTANRAEVAAELKNGQAMSSQAEFTPPDANFVSTKTRAQVYNELKQAQADGTYALIHQEYEGQFPALSNGTANSRLVRSGKPGNLN